MKSSKCFRAPKGASIAEFAGALALFLPLLIAIIYVVLEASYAYAIKTNLDVACRRAARDLAIRYGANPQLAQTQYQNVYTAIRIPNFVVDNGQFSQPTFDTTAAPGTVTVTVNYPTGGAFGLPRFPNPDPLNLGPNFVINSTATFSLE